MTTFHYPNNAYGSFSPIKDYYNNSESSNIFRPTNDIIDTYLNSSRGCQDYFLISKFGCFVILPSWPENELYYKSKNGDMKVHQLSIGKVTQGNSIIARVNGQIVPTIALQQLKIILQSSGKWRHLLDEINKYSSEIEKSVEDMRRIYSSYTYLQ